MMTFLEEDTIENGTRFAIYSEGVLVFGATFLRKRPKKQGVCSPNSEEVCEIMGTFLRKRVKKQGVFSPYTVRGIKTFNDFFERDTPRKRYPFRHI